MGKLMVIAGLFQANEAEDRIIKAYTDALYGAGLDAIQEEQVEAELAGQRLMEQSEATGSTPTELAVIAALCDVCDKKRKIIKALHSRMEEQGVTVPEMDQETAETEKRLEELIGDPYQEDTGVEIQ